MPCVWLRSDAWHGNAPYCERTGDYLSSDDCSCDEYEEVEG
jgi:hypothetical protein